MKITSVNNDLIKSTAKLLKTKYREETGLFLIEGEKGVKEAIEANLEIENIFVLEGYDKIQEKNIIEVSEPVLAKISETKSPPKIIAVAKQPQYNIKILQNSQNVVLLENIKDAGNLGTIIRTAVAFNIDAIVLCGETVDLYNPKCIRSAVGNLWKIPIFKINDYNDLKTNFKDFERIATLPKGQNIVNLKDYESKKKKLIMFGSEAEGLTEKLKNFATKNITIEMAENVESLNLSVSVAIMMYKISIL